MNIGVHLMDMLLWKFGPCYKAEIIHRSDETVIGVLHLQKAEVNFKLSTRGKPQRKMIMDGQVINFSDGFTDLHTTCYREIHEGNGYGIDDCYEVIKLINQL
jgi:UDP-N-acetyl-2-amino-2-deoxyglucuronate dehydrogenase